MRNFYNLVLSSSKELKNARNLAVVGLLIAIKLILELFSIQLTPFLKISFGFLASGAIGLLFGPIVGAMSGGLSDIINYVAHPTGPFFIGFTLSAMITGALYGIVLYKKEVTIKRCIIIEVIVMIFINVLLNTFFLNMLYGKAFFAILPARIIKSIIAIPINVIMLQFVLKIVEKIEKNNFKN